MEIVRRESDDLLNELTEGSGLVFIPKIKLLQKLSAEFDSAKFRERNPDARPGDYVIGWKDDAELVGNALTVVPTAWRAHALQLNDENEVVAESYDAGSEEFRQIREAADGGDKRAMFGADILLYYVERAAFYVVYFAKTARQAISPLVENIDRPVILTSKEVGKRHRWFIPEVLPANGIERPTITEKQLEMTLELFENPVQEGEEEQLNR